MQFLRHDNSNVHICLKAILNETESIFKSRSLNMGSDLQNLYNGPSLQRPLVFCKVKAMPPKDDYFGIAVLHEKVVSENSKV